MSSSLDAPHSRSEPQLRSFTPPARPNFNSRRTDDRIREGSGRIPTFSMIKNTNKDRKSIFRETGLLDDGDTAYTDQPALEREYDSGDISKLTSDSRPGTSETEGDAANTDSRRETPHQDDDSTTSPGAPTRKSSWYSKLTPGRRPQVKMAGVAPPPTMSTISRFTMVALLIAVVLPGFSYNNGRTTVGLSGAKAGVIRKSKFTSGPVLDVRANSPTEVCTRWSQQSALLNGTLYIYGGQAKATGDQKINTWNNNFLTLDLTKSWDAQSPALNGLPQPSGLPAVANGYLWNDYNNLFLYGGEFADNPYVNPASISTWKYGIASQTWTEYKDPQTSAGNNSAPGGVPVQRSAEGAGISVPELGMSWYFGGHLDLATTPGWSNQIARVFLKSLLEFTHPGYLNNGVQSLSAGTGAGEGGAYRNITEGGLQTDQGFSERADGALVFVPGWGTSGVLIGLGGGIDSTFTFSNDFSTLDVYDIANSEWYHQQTTGEAPDVRVNPCTVIASAPDASSFQVYVYGGQNLQPYKEQIQYNDMYILSIPAFTWIRVPDQSNPPAGRAGHSCHLRDGQMVVVGGYVGNTIPCDSPGIHVFNATSLQWQSKFQALSPKADLHPDNSVLAASFGYKVPDAVVRVIGGSGEGAATVTTPAAGPATGGPFATGHPPVYTVTASGSTATVTQWGPDATNAGGPNGASGPGGSSGSKATSAGLIAAGVIAGLAGLLAGYLGYCAWLYRRQVRAYRSHLAVANRYSGAAASKTSFGGGLAALFARKSSKGSKGSKGSRKRHRDGGYRDVDEVAYKEKFAYGGAAGAAAGAGARPGLGHGGHDRYESTSTADSFAWVGREDSAPRGAWLSNEPTPSGSLGTTGTGTGSGGSSGFRRSSASPFGNAPGGEERPYNWFAQGSQQQQQQSQQQQQQSQQQQQQPQPQGSGSALPAAGRQARRGSDSAGSVDSMEHLLDGQEMSFFSVVMGPRRALRVVNGLEEGERELE